MREETDHSRGFWAEALGLLLVAAIFYGWVMNIVYLATATEFSGLLLLRAVGVFAAPIGIVLGYVGGA